MIRPDPGEWHPRMPERLDEIGLDFAIIYPTRGLRVPRVGADKPRRAAARAYNIVTAEYFRPFLIPDLN